MAGKANKDDDYVGYGFAYPLRVNLQGEFDLSSGETNIEESIKIILRTNLGERLYRPDFGSRLSELEFEPVNAETLLLSKMYTEEAIKKWEPRISLKQVIAEPKMDGSLIDLRIVYEIKKTRNTRSMIYPFYVVPEDNSFESPS